MDRGSSRPRRSLCVALMTLAMIAVHAAAQPAGQNLPKPQASDEQPSGSSKPRAAAPSETTALSAAETIARLQQQLEADEARLQELLKEKERFETGEYPTALKDFSAIEEKLKALKKEKPAEDPGKTTDLPKQLAELEKQRGAAHERLQVAIERPKALQTQIATLEKKMQLDREAIDRLRGGDESKPKPAAPAPPVRPEGAAEPAKKEAAAPAVQPTLAQPAAAKPEGEAPAAIEKPQSPEAIEARRHAEAKKLEAEAAQQEVVSIEERIRLLREQIDQETRNYQAAQKASDLADEQLQQLQRTFVDAGSPEEQSQALERMREHEEQRAKAKTEARTARERQQSLWSQLDALYAQQEQASGEAARRAREAQRAEQEAEQWENPFSPRNLLRWLITSGPRVLAILLGMFLLRLLARALDGRIVELLSRGAPQGATSDRENRAKTLVGVFHNTISLAVVAGGSLMILQEMGVNVAVLMGGAAVVGLAVAFGAQNLIRDYFSGFMILLENQYTINDVVRIGGIAGQVERITLRMTALRDLEGVIHFIPNGQITSVSNMTHGWSRALFEVGVAYKEDVDRVMQVLTELGRQLRKDPAFAFFILEDPTMLGVDQLGDSAVVVKFYIKTRPLQQWNVKRELLRRIKRRFDELGIEIPFPHRTVYHRDLQPPVAPPAGESLESTNHHGR